MDTSYEHVEEEAVPLISRPGIPTAIKDTRKPYQKQLAIHLILASLLFERISFYSIAANLVISLGSDKALDWHYSNTLIASFIFSGTSYISTIIFAIISDWRLGRAKTIVVGFSLYLIGYILTILITNPSTYTSICYPLNGNKATITTTILDETCAKWILPTLIIIGFGAGAVQSNIAVLGSEQTQESKTTSRYFDKYLVAVNIGSVIARLVIPYIQKDRTVYYIGYIVAASTLSISGILFVIGWKFYIHVKPQETVVTNCIPVIFNAFQTRSQHKNNKYSAINKRRLSTASNLLNVSGSLAEGDESIRIIEKPSTFLDYAKAVNYGKFHDRIVDDVKSLRNAFIVFGFFIPYWLIYTQIYSSFPLQGRQMDTFDEPRLVTWVSLGDPVTIIIGIVVLNMVVYKCVNARNRAISIVMKFVIGMIFACIAMCLAGSIEEIRETRCDNNTSLHENSSSLPIYYQLPQHIGMGLSEIFGMIASYEFAYYAAPLSAQSLFMSLRFCSIGIASFLGAAYSTIFSRGSMKLDFSCSSLPDTKWRLYTYFYVLAGIQLISMIIFIICQKKFQIIKLNPQQMERNQFVSQRSTSSANRQ